MEKGNNTKGANEHKKCDHQMNEMKWNGCVYARTIEHENKLNQKREEKTP